MLTEDQIKYYADGCCTDNECNTGRLVLGDEVVRLRDEIKWLRAQNDKLRGWLDESRSVIEAYQTPNVDEIEVKKSC